MTKILYVSQFYPPENIAGAFRAHEHAQKWSQDGHDVTIMTGWPNYPLGRIFDGYKPCLLEESFDGAVRLLRSKLIARPNTNLLGRIANGCSFLFFGAINVLFNGRKIGNDYDVVLASSGTIFAGYVGLLYAKTRRVPLVAEFRDLTFEQMMATGQTQASWKVRIMRVLELYFARSADRVVVLTEGFRKALAVCGVGVDKIDVVPNGADVQSVDKVVSARGIRLGYFGTLGLSQNIAETLELAALIERVAAEPVRYTLIGEGAARHEVENALRSGYPFAKLLHGMPPEQLERYYRECDLTFVSLQRSDSFRATIPSKIFQSFARGVPVLFVGPDGEAAEIIRDAGAGLVLCGSDEDNERALRVFFGDPDWRQRLAAMGECAQKMMQESYSREVLAERMLKVLCSTSKTERSDAR